MIPTIVGVEEGQIHRGQGNSFVFPQLQKPLTEEPPSVQPSPPPPPPPSSAPVDAASSTDDEVDEEGIDTNTGQQATSQGYKRVGDDGGVTEEHDDDANIMRDDAATIASLRAALKVSREETRAAREFLSQELQQTPFERAAKQQAEGRSWRQEHGFNPDDPREVRLKVVRTRSGPST